MRNSITSAKSYSTFGELDIFETSRNFEPFNGFVSRKPKKATKKEEQETSEGIEAKLTQIGKRKFSLGV